MVLWSFSHEPAYICNSNENNVGHGYIHGRGMIIAIAARIGLQAEHDTQTKIRPCPLVYHQVQVLYSLGRPSNGLVLHLLSRERLHTSSVTWVTGPLAPPP